MAAASTLGVERPLSAPAYVRLPTCLPARKPPMTTSSLPAAHDPRRTALGRALVAAVWAAAAAGAVVGAIALAGAGTKQAAPSSAPGLMHVGQRITTSFGTMSVDYVVRLVGAPNPMG